LAIKQARDGPIKFLNNYVVLIKEVGPQNVTFCHFVTAEANRQVFCQKDKINRDMKIFQKHC
jgi:hypothetical protein